MPLGRIRGVLLDLGGVVFIGDAPIPGSIDAVARLRDAGIGVRFLTNTTRRPARTLISDLAKMGLAVRDEELLTPARVARRWLEAGGMVPHLLMHPAIEEEFAGLPSEGPVAVVVGDAAEGFSYRNLNAAFRQLDAGARFIALARNRCFTDRDGHRSLDAGAFVAALEYGSRREAEVVGKPARAFFEEGVASLGLPAGEVVMIGDDAEADIGGALAAGFAGILVRTGKYRAGDEESLPAPPDLVCDDLASAASAILDT